MWRYEKQQVLIDSQKTLEQKIRRQLGQSDDHKTNLSPGFSFPKPNCRERVKDKKRPDSKLPRHGHFTQLKAKIKDVDQMQKGADKIAYRQNSKIPQYWKMVDPMFRHVNEFAHLKTPN